MEEEPMKLFRNYSNLIIKDKSISKIKDSK